MDASDTGARQDAEGPVAAQAARGRVPGRRAAASDPPLAVDLDGTLARVDTLHETLVTLPARQGAAGLGRTLAALARLGRGKADVKAALAAFHLPDPALIPYREAVLQEIRAARADGRRVVLVTAADQRVADAVAKHLGLFDEVHGSRPGCNLGGRRKAELLVRRFGEGGFDYIGDSRIDAPVWAAARRAITAGAGGRARRAAEAASSAPARHLDAPAQGLSRLKPWLRAMRPHQWAKNSLVFLPLVAAHGAAPDGALLNVVLAFAAFSLTASSAYAINDLLDLEADRAHPRKRLRPFAAGDATALGGVVLGAGLIAAGLALAASVSPPLLAVVLFYYVATLAYSLDLKRRLAMDICVLAGLYTLRVLAGAAAAGLFLSPWLLALSVFLFLSLAAMKRQIELVDAVAAGKEPSGRAYRAADLPIVTMMAVSAAYVAVLVLALYIYTPQVRAQYASPLMLWGAPPILLYWLSRLIMLAHRGKLDDDPVLYAVKDPTSLACGAGFVAVAAAAKFL